MKNQGKAFIIWMLISIVSFLVMSISFMIMYLLTADIENRASGGLAVVPGLMFWGGLILSIISHIIMGVMRNRIVERGRIKRSNLQRYIGLICFFRNTAALIADVVFVLALAALIVTLVICDTAGMLTYALISLTVFAFSMHCTLNGKNFNFLIKQ